jgi:hypothetical protein
VYAIWFSKENSIWPRLTKDESNQPYSIALVGLLDKKKSVFSKRREIKKCSH